jgi:ribonuclease Y
MLEKKEERLNKLIEDERELLEQERNEVKIMRREIKQNLLDSEVLKKRYDAKLDETLEILEKSASLTRDEAKSFILEKVEEDSRAEIAHIVRKYENEAKVEAKRKANYILAQATTRYAGDFAAERLINIVNLYDDELKGRIIGKEGRNIKALEMLLGVDIIIDDTPNAILLSSFNLYRRAIATKTLELLIEDGRIQPARIEEIFEKVTKEFEQSLIEEGENIILDLGLSGIHPEIVKLIGKLKYRASYGQNALGHSLEVAHLSGIMAAEMGANELLAKRAGLLHDIGKALTHEYSGNHVDLGAEICKRYKESDIVINAIYSHHGHEEPKTIEAACVCTADTLSAARPGARREVLESFLKRVSDIEAIANSKFGVKQVYAINAGREVRVIVNANLISDEEAVLLSKEIAKDIKTNVQFPGEIKVNVIREVRAIEFAS